MTTPTPTRAASPTRLPWWVPWAARAIQWIVRGIGITLRYRWAEGEAHFDRLRRGEPFVIVYFHHQLFLAAPFLSREVLRRGVPLTLLSSQSRDGELGARLGAALGATVVRGSSTRGGMRAFRRLVEAVRRKRSSVVLITDGPRGPAGEVKESAVALAARTGAPVLPLVFVCRRGWRLGSWDRTWIPRPFTTVRVAALEPVMVPPGDREAQERARLDVQRRLHETEARMAAEDQAP